MKVLVIGSGGREHAIVWKLAQSPEIDELYCAPGNGGIAQLAKCVDIGVKDIPGIVRFAVEESMDWVFVAPDDPLADGMVDALEAAGVKAYGPTARAAQIEASKHFAKSLMDRYGIPTARWAAFQKAEEAKEYIRSQGAPIVVKADGLSLGKGVFVAQTVEEALASVDAIMEEKIFGEAGSEIIVEECMTGYEVSALCFTDGHTVVPMVTAQDHKRAYDGDLGPNTGGMGAYAPVAKLSEQQLAFIREKILQSAVDGMRMDGTPFKGVLYAGLMVTEEGIKVVEFNARLGDPETQVIFPLLDTDLFEIVKATRDETLSQLNVRWKDGAAAVVVIASGGYPGAYQKGYEITGLSEAALHTDAYVFHAGTKQVGEKIVTSGGRVLGVTGLAEDVPGALDKAYAAVREIHFKDCFYRKDIGRGR